MVKALKDYLARFIELTEEEIEQLTTLAEVRTYDKKVKLIDQGEYENHFNFIIRGLARKYFLREDEEIITQLAKEGEIINSSVSFLSGERSLYIVETIEPTTFLSFSRDSIEKLYAADKKWQRLGRLIITDLFLQKENWDLERILYSTQERFVRFLSTNSNLFQRVPQKYLASYLNIQPETFSRLKHLLRTKSTTNTAISL
ncbi:MAG TPA: Crp/Fnr family transcriptional regulator [Flavitalea sp.]|nr:Crp/Fnr family transcriptional regulator [Flavitalea sp.]